MSAITVDAFAEALAAAIKSPTVVESLYNALMPSIENAIRAAVDVALADTYIRLDNQAKEIGHLTNENTTLRRQVDELDAYSRSDNIIVYGIKEAYAEVSAPASSSASNANSHQQQMVGETSATSEAAFIQFCNEQLHVSVHPNDISVVHRLPKSNKWNGPRPMIIRFSNKKARMRVMAAKKSLRQNQACRNVYINEHLTKSASQLFEKARGLVRDKKVSGAWTWNGRVFLKTLSGQTKPINCDSELYQY